MFKHRGDFKECIKREKWAEGAIFNPLISKAKEKKKVLSYIEQESEKPGQQAISRFRHTQPCMEMLLPACEDSAEKPFRFIHAGSLES